jgi:exodeoxyribonuclease V beta subunit
MAKKTQSNISPKIACEESKDLDLKNLDLNKHIFIEASAGTGKTYTITRIYLKHILEKEIDYKKIILLTFTTKATQEMLLRVRELIQQGLKEKKLDFLKNENLNDKQIKCLKNMLKHFDQLRISTIHSFCKSLLNEYPFELNLPSNTEIIDNNEEIIREIILNLFLNKKNNSTDVEIDLEKLSQSIDFNKLLKYINRFISESARRENIQINFIEEKITLKDILNKNFKSVKDETLKELINLFYFIYEQLGKYKKFHGIFTYDDLILHLYNALKDNHSFKKQMQNLFQVCIVDEFQDTDPYQWEIFKSLFLEKENNKLIVVGDFKQSIYGFRGADIYTYWNAKDYLKNESKKKDNTNFLSLNTNYRSTKEFIEVSNNFMKDLKDLVETIDINDEVKSKFKIESIKPPQIQLTEENQNIYSYYKPINFIEVEGDNADNCRGDLSIKIVKTIKDLIHKEVKVYTKNESDKNAIRTIKYSDIAILVRGQEEAKFITPILKKNNIPFIDYLKDNVFSTLEASAIQLLLEYLANPNDSKIKKRFITYYFLEIPYTDISKIEEYYSKIQSTISDWTKYLSQNNWYQLFYKVIEDTKLYYKYLALPDYERKITNYEHIIEILVELATKNHYGPIELYEEFKQLKENQEDQDKYNIRLESEEDKIHILTMHKSKGLEFPVVFILGWFNYQTPRTGDNDNYKFYDHTSNDKLWNICFFYQNTNESKSKSIKKLIREEYFFEEFRLFYVAITRAKSYLFLPKYPEKGYGDFSFMGFLYNIAKEIFNNNEKSANYKLIKYDDKNAITQDSVNPPKEDSKKIDSKQNNEITNIIEIFEHLKKIESISYNEKRYTLNSYSSLTGNIYSTMNEQDYDEIEERREIQNIEYTTEPTQSKSLTKFDEYFKSGAKTGSFIHKIFEKINFKDFKDVKDDATKKALLNKYKNLFNYYNQFYSIYEDNQNKETFYKFLIDFLCIILNNKINHEFSLSEINPEYTKKEIGFLIQDIHPIKEFEPLLNNNFFTGNLDLFFEHNNKYYLLDYKTSTLNDYSKESLREFTENHYKIQYLLYSYALYLWLNQVKNHSLEEKLPGGIIYYYLRGYKESTKGIYYKEFDDFKTIYNKIKEYLKNN